MPDLIEVHIDQPLTNISVGYRNVDYVGHLLFPEVPVVKESDRYFVYDKSNLRVEEALVAPGAEAGEVDYSLTTDSYVADERAYRHLIPDRIRNNMDNPLDADRDATLMLTDKLALRYEVDAADRATNLNNYGVTHRVTLSGTSQWSDYGNSDPFADIEAARDVVQGDTLKDPNIIVISWPVWLKLKQHPAFIDRIKHTRIGNMTPQLLADLLEIQMVVIAKAMRNTAAQGLADSLVRCWGKDVVIAYVETAPNLMSVSFGKTFRTARAVRRWREERRKGDMIQVEDTYALKVIDSNCGYLIKSAVA